MGWGGGGGGASCSSVDFVFVCTLLVIIGGSCHKYHSCHDKSFVMTNVFVMANTSFVVTELLSKLNDVCFNILLS